MKILHASCIKESHNHLGILQQLAYEHDATQSLSSKWDTTSYSIDNNAYPFSQQFPKFFRNALTRRLYFFVKIASVANKYDAILIRYLPLDPFILILSLMTRNILTVHHWGLGEGKRSIMEKLNILLLKAIVSINGRFISVTKGIGLDMQRRLKSRERFFLLTNGITIPTNETTQQGKRSNTSIEIAFVASNFYPWHGLEALTKSIADDCDEDFLIHIIGNLTDKTEKAVKSVPKSESRFKIHGSIPPERIPSILSQCRIGIGTLSPEGTGLADACTLKTREYLKAGLLVYSGLPDSGLPKDFPYFRSGPASIKEIIEFAKRHSNVPPIKIRNSAAYYINKKSIMQSFLSDLEPESNPAIV